MNFTSSLRTFFSLLFFLFVVLILQAQPVNNIVGDVVLPAPNAAALGKYGDIPVSYHTGVPSIDVPIHTVHSGPLSLPISLNYHSSGVKVAETASWVGLGWSLNAGGIITRVIQGLPDDDPIKYGYYHDGGDLNPTSATHNHEINAGLRDPEPDIFSFNVGGYSGKFYFDVNQTPVFIPKQDLLLQETVDGNGKFERFILIAPDGSRYIFGKTLDGNNSAIEKSYSTGEDLIFQNSSFYLVKVESPDGLYSIDLHYTEENYTYINPGSSRFVQTMCASGSGGYTWSSGPLVPNYLLKTTVSGYRLQSITSPTASISFIADTLREDLDPYFGPGANRLDAIEISTGGLCKRFDFSYEYFFDIYGTKPSQSGNVDKRLKLTQLQEKSCDQSIIVPPYTFTYEGDYHYHQGEQYQFLPHRLDKSVDHWGYYNNAALNNSEPVNAPAVDVYHMGSVVYSYDNGVVDRESHEGKMLLGSLKKIDYPTGGYTEFELEANEVKGEKESPRTYLITLLGDPDTDCGNVITVTDQCTIPVSEDDLKYHLSFQETTCTHSQQNPVLKIYEAGSGALNQTIDLGTEEVIAGSFGDIADLNLINEGQAYTFELTVYEELTVFRLYHSTIDTADVAAGGLRIKQIKTHDGIDASNDMVKTYDYTGEDGFSSGFTYNKPIYGYYLEGGFIAETSTGAGGLVFVPVNAQTVVINSQSIAPMASFTGKEVGYTRVKEIQSGRGTQLFHYTEEIGFVSQQEDQYGYNTFPHAPKKYHMGEGELEASEIFRGNESTPLSTTENTPENPLYDYSYGFKLKMALISCPTVNNGPFNPGFGVAGTVHFWNQYQIRTGAYRLTSVESMLDGVVTITDYEYDSQDRFLYPTATQFTNSDGKIHRTENTYIHDYTACGAVRDSMIEKNMIATPYQTINKVGGTTVSGAQTTFKFFDGSGNYANCSPAGAFPRPHEYSNYEMTFSGGNPTGGGWELAGTVQDYTDGYPKTFVKTHWKPETYEWQNGLIKKRTFEAFVWQYAYLPGTRLMSSFTDIDGQSIAYDYDELGRLKKSTVRGGAAETDYTYHYTSGPGDYNYLRAATTYDVMPGSEVEDMTDYRYFDGLGRLMQTVRVEYAPNHSDVVLGVDYDGAGRLTTEYVPIESGGSGGAYFSIPSGTAAAFRTYEASPLDRLESEAPAGGYTTLYEYGNNDGGEVDPGTGSYADNTLYKVIATDPNGNQVEGFSDIAGRSLLSRKIGIDGLIGDTYSLYDDKDRVSKVIPPGALIGDDGLTFRYTYDGADNVLSKKIPDQALIDMKYNDRDLMTLSRDGNMLAGGKWLHSKYDDYGRVTATGFVGGSSPDPNGNLSFSQQLTSTSYDGAGGIETGKVVQSGAVNLSSASWLSTDFKYDGFGRVESTSGNHHLNSSPTAETVSFSYDLLDNITNQSRSHNGPEDLSITQSYTYDHSGRKIDAFHQLGNDTLDRVHIARHFYNERDFVLWKQLHKAPNGEFLQKVDYTYNDAGWLLTINDVNAVDGAVLPDCNKEDPGGGTCGEMCDYTLSYFCSGKTYLTGLYVNGGDLVPLNYDYECFDYLQLEVDLENWLDANGISYQGVFISFFESTITITITQTELPFNYVSIWSKDVVETGQDVYFTRSNCQTVPPVNDICDLCASFGFDCHKCPYEQLQDTCATCQAIGITGNCSLCDGSGDYCQQCQDLGYNSCESCPLTVEMIHPLELQIEYSLQDFTGSGPYCSPVRVTEVAQYYLHDSTSRLQVLQKTGIVGNLDSLSTSTLSQFMKIDLSTEWVKQDNVQQVIDSIQVKVAAELSMAGISSSLVQDDFTATVEAVLLKSWEGLPTATGDEGDLPGYNPDLFALSLSYHGDNSVSGAPKQYNGNISEMTWVTAGRLPQTYGFWYDGFGRIEKGKHFDLLEDGSYSTDNKYGTDYTYDLRGNILSLSRNGADGGCTFPSGIEGHSFGQIDDLTYTYTPGKNQLSFIQEASNKDYGFKNDGGSVSYDANGNMTDVDYKKMTVSYNYLNLPESITDNLTNSSLGFMYDAAGTKLRKTVSDAQDPNASYTQDYVQGIEYRDNNLEAIYFEEGRVIKDGDDYLYEYYLKDHLGNTRVVFSDKNNDGALQPFNNNGYPVAVDYSELLQESHYYPFGMNMDGPWTETINGPENRYLYNGKELNEDFGLDWLDYGARWYDASIARWGQVDPMAEKYYPISPYAYVANNPLIFVDPDGRKIEYAKEMTKKQKRILKKHIRKGKRKSKTFRTIWKVLKKDKNNTHTFHIGDELSVRAKVSEDGSRTNSTNITIDLNSTTSEGGERPLAVGIGHELGHAYRHNEGLVAETTPYELGNKDFFVQMHGELDAIRRTEEGEASHIENIIRAEFDPSGKQIKLREKYSNILQNTKLDFSKFPLKRIIEVHQVDISAKKEGFNYYSKNLHKAFKKKK